MKKKLPGFSFLLSDFQKLNSEKCPVQYSTLRDDGCDPFCQIDGWFGDAIILTFCVWPFIDWSKIIRCLKCCAAAAAASTTLIHTHVPVLLLLQLLLFKPTYSLTYCSLGNIINAKNLSFTYSTQSPPTRATAAGTKLAKSETVQKLSVPLPVPNLEFQWHIFAFNEFIGILLDHVNTKINQFFGWGHFRILEFPELNLLA